MVRYFPRKTVKNTEMSVLGIENISDYPEDARIASRQAYQKVLISHQVAYDTALKHLQGTLGVGDTTMYSSGLLCFTPEFLPDTIVPPVWVISFTSDTAELTVWVDASHGKVLHTSS